MNLESILSLIVAALLLVYLAYALLRPEKFEMSLNGRAAILFFFALILAVTKPLGVFMAMSSIVKKTFGVPHLKTIDGCSKTDWHPRIAPLFSRMKTWAHENSSGLVTGQDSARKTGFAASR